MRTCCIACVFSACWANQGTSRPCTAGSRPTADVAHPLRVRFARRTTPFERTRPVHRPRPCSGRCGCAGASREALGACGNHALLLKHRPLCRGHSTGLQARSPCLGTRAGARSAVHAWRWWRSRRGACTSNKPRERATRGGRSRACGCTPRGAHSRQMQRSALEPVTTATRSAPCSRRSGARAPLPRLRALVLAVALVALLRPVGAWRFCGARAGAR